jgi:hypothetical protein
MKCKKTNDLCFTVSSMQDHENMSFWFKGFVQQIIKRKENIYSPIPIILEHMANLSSSLITPDSLK